MAREPSAEDIENYLDHNRLSAKSANSEYDVIITHDPQPVAFRRFAGRRGAKWVWEEKLIKKPPAWLPGAFCSLVSATPQSSPF